MKFTETDLYLSIKNNNLTKLVEILRQYNLTKYEFFNNRITFISLAVIRSKFRRICSSHIENLYFFNSLKKAPASQSLKSLLSMGPT